MKRLAAALLASSSLTIPALVAPALAQRQPAQITTMPATIPQEFDLLDKTGAWVPFGTASGGVFSPVNPSGVLDLKSFGPVYAKCDGATDDNASIVAAAAAAKAAGVALRIPDAACYSSLALNFGSMKLIGASPVIAHVPPSGPTIMCPASIAAPCVTMGTPSTGTNLGSSVRDLLVTYSGTPVAGDQALVVQGFGSILDDVMPYNAWDGLTVKNAVSTHVNMLHTWKIWDDHVLVDSSQEVYIVNARMGMNNATDYLNGNAFIGFTGAEPDSVYCIGCQLNLGNAAPKYLWDFAGITAQANGGYYLSHSTADMSLGNALAAIHTDGTGTCYRCSWDDVQVNMPAHPMFSGFGSAAAMTQAIFANSQLWVSDFTMPAGKSPDAFHVSNVDLTGTLTIDGNGGNASFSGIRAAGVITVQGGPWGALTINGLRSTSATVPPYNDTTATGAVYVSGVASMGWTPQPQFGGASVGMTFTSGGRASRQGDGTIKAIFGVQFSAKGTSTGTFGLAGMPYSCLGLGYGPQGAGPIYASTMPGLAAGAVLASITPPATSAITLNQSGAGGWLSSLTDANFTNTSDIAGTVSCIPQ